MGVLSVFTQPIESKEKPRANAPYSELAGGVTGRGWLASEEKKRLDTGTVGHQKLLKLQ